MLQDVRIGRSRAKFDPADGILLLSSPPALEILEITPIKTTHESAWPVATGADLRPVPAHGLPAQRSARMASGDGAEVRQSVSHVLVG